MLFDTWARFMFVALFEQPKSLFQVIIGAASVHSGSVRGFEAVVPFMLGGSRDASDILGIGHARERRKSFFRMMAFVSIGAFTRSASCIVVQRGKKQYCCAVCSISGMMALVSG